MGSEPETPLADGADLLSAVLIAAILVVVLLLAVTTLGLAPTDGQPYEITADPAAGLPY
jgi:hypothetical protein